MTHHINKKNINHVIIIKSRKSIPKKLTFITIKKYLLTKWV